ncbi:MAG: ATP-binding protein [Pseudobdellovibrionaceae bacterium]|nr:ATP-binding protein [Pseudobdellovibrionaceae bacterium]
MKLRKAERKKVFVKVGLTAPSGHGKTFSSLLIARGLAGSWEKVCLIDTEGSGDKYAGHKALGPYHVINLFENEQDPDRFSPARWVEAMKMAADAGMEVIVLDSATHEWQWCLELKENLNKSINDWKSITPHHNKFIRAILHCHMHAIVCTRRKTEYVQSESNGKKTVEKVGMKSEMRSGFEYELDVNIGLSRNHLATIEKDRAGIFHERPEFVPSEATGRELLAWSRAEELKPEADRQSVSNDAPISASDPRIQAWIHKRLKELQITEGLWPVILQTVDGCPRNELRARLDEAASLTQKAFDEDFTGETA